MREINNKQYEQFTPEERVQLTFAALARNDEAEANRLWETCPRHRYRVPDLAYTERVNAHILIGSVFFQKCVRHYNTIKKIEALISDFLHDLEHEEQTGMTELADKTRKLIDKAEDTKTKGITQLKSIFFGFERFCNHVGIRHNDVLKSLDIEEICHDIDLILSSTVVVEDCSVTRFYDTFLSYWNF